jgi:hypothetical protein
VVVAAGSREPAPPEPFHGTPKACEPLVADTAAWAGPPGVGPAAFECRPRHLGGAASSLP